MFGIFCKLAKLLNSFLSTKMLEEENFLTRKITEGRKKLGQTFEGVLSKQARHWLGLEHRQPRWRRQQRVGESSCLLHTAHHSGAPCSRRWSTFAQ